MSLDAYRRPSLRDKIRAQVEKEAVVPLEVPKTEADVENKVEKRKVKGRKLNK